MPTGFLDYVVSMTKRCLLSNKKGCKNFKTISIREITNYVVQPYTILTIYLCTDIEF